MKACKITLQEAQLDNIRTLSSLVVGRANLLLFQRHIPPKMAVLSPFPYLRGNCKVEGFFGMGT
jgi:hypothetical protein